MEAAHQPGGGSALADGEDGVCADLLRRSAGRVGCGGRYRKPRPPAGHLGHAFNMVDIALCLPGNGVHGFHRLHRILARRRLAGEHNGGGAIVNGVGHIGDLRAGGAGIFNHGIQHLGRRDDRLSAGHALGDHILLNNGDLGEVDLHAHIAAGHHDAVRRVQNLRQIADALLIFDLRNDADARAGLIQQASQLPDVCGGTDKAGSHIVKALLHAEEEILPVPLAHIGHTQPHAGDVDPLVILHHAVVLHPAADLRPGSFQHRQPHQTVIQQDGVSRLHVIGQVGIGDGAAVNVSLRLRCGQGKFLPGGQADGTVRKVLQPDLRPFGIQHGGNRGVQLFPQSFQGVQPRFMFRMGTVGKVEPGHIHPCQNHLPQNAFLVRRRPQGAYDFCFPHL